MKCLSTVVMRKPWLTYKSLRTSQNKICHFRSHQRFNWKWLMKLWCLIKVWSLSENHVSLMHLKLWSNNSKKPLKTTICNSNTKRCLKSWKAISSHSCYNHVQLQSPKKTSHHVTTIMWASVHWNRSRLLMYPTRMFSSLATDPYSIRRTTFHLTLRRRITMRMSWTSSKLSLKCLKRRKKDCSRS